MTREQPAYMSNSFTDAGKYYIMYDPTTAELMGKIGDRQFDVVDIVEYLTGKKLDTCTENNFTDFLTFDTHHLRKGMLEHIAIEPYSSYYIANQICRADGKAKVMLADDNRRTIGQIIASEGKKQAAVFMSVIS